MPAPWDTPTSYFAPFFTSTSPDMRADLSECVKHLACSPPPAPPRVHTLHFLLRRQERQGIALWLGWGRATEGTTSARGGPDPPSSFATFWGGSRPHTLSCHSLGGGSCTVGRSKTFWREGDLLPGLNPARLDPRPSTSHFYRVADPCFALSPSGRSDGRTSAALFVTGTALFCDRYGAQSAWSAGERA